MKFVLIAAAAAATIAAAAPAEAQYRDRYRDARQEQRIRDGYYSGRLTGREAAGLAYQNHRIDQYRRHSIMDDGRIDYRERRNLDRMRDRASRDIYREKHDRRYRRW